MPAHRNLALLLLLLTFVVAPLTAQNCGGSWQQIFAPGSPAPRHGCHKGAVFDSARGVTVVFGGSTGLAVRDTWEFDGTTWTLRSLTGPDARGYHAMVYDSARQRTVLFGGISWAPVQYYGDTWEWDGQTWTQVATTGPSARWLHTMTYDSVRQRTVMFGGMNPDLSNPTDTWEWDGTTWTQVATTGPSGRNSSASGFDVGSGLVILQGGSTYQWFTDETWAWNGTVWSLLGSSNGNALDAHSMAYCNATGRLMMWGGAACCYSNPTDLWSWNGTSWSVYPVVGGNPGGRQENALVYDSVRGKLLALFGGVSGGSPPSTDLLWSWTPPSAPGAGVPLGSNHPSAVEWPVSAGGNGHKYQVVTSNSACGVTWLQANHAALDAGGHLATVTSAGENAFIFGLIDQSAYWTSGSGESFGPWMGGMQPAGSPEPGGGFRWITGEAMSYVSWNSAPDNGCGGTDNRMCWWSPSGRSSTWGDMNGDGCAGNIPVAYVVEYEPTLVCTAPTSAFYLCVAHDPQEGSRLQLFNLPQGTIVGKTLVSSTPSFPVGSGSFYGITPDMLTMTILLMPNVAGDPTTWVVGEPGLFPDTPYMFPPSLMAPFLGTTWDFRAVALTSTGGIHFSNIVQKTW